MQVNEIKFKITIPPKSEFSKTYKQFGNLIKEEGSKVYDYIVTPEIFIRAMSVSDIGMPAVSVVAENCSKMVPDLKDKLFMKQFIGAVTCYLMESNGYKKSHKKKTIPHDCFSKGEVFVKE